MNLRKWLFENIQQYRIDYIIIFMSSKYYCNNRYEFISPLDSGGSGIAQLGRDVHTGERVFIKASNVLSRMDNERQIGQLKNEELALMALEGCNAPSFLQSCKRSIKLGDEVFDEYCIIMEFIPPDCSIEKNPTLNNLTEIEYAEIFYQLFSCLSKAHYQGFNHGDLEVKHLYWQQNYNRLVIIDWGNTQHSLPPNSDNIAFDLKKAAEIIRSFLIDHNDLPKYKSVPNSFIQLIREYPKNGRSEINLEEINAKVLADDAYTWLDNLYNLAQESVSAIITGWTVRPSGGKWQDELLITLKVMPNFVLGQIIDNALIKFDLLEKYRDKEKEYIEACQKTNWGEARDIVNELLSEKLIPLETGLLLGRVLYNLELINVTRGPEIQLAVTAALGQTLDDRIKDSGWDGRGDALLAICAREILHASELAEFKNFLEKNSLKFQTMEFLNRIGYASIDRENYENIKLWFENASEIDSLSSAFQNYRRLFGFLNKVLEQYSANVHTEQLSRDLNWFKSFVLFKIETIIETFSIVIDALNVTEKPKASEGLLKIWLLDHECKIAYIEWSRIVPTILPAYTFELFRQQPLELQNALMSAQKKLIEIIVTYKTQYEQSIFIQKVMSDLPKSMPTGWQLVPPIVDFFCVLEAYVYTLKSGHTPQWLENIGVSDTKLHQTKWLKDQIFNLSRKKSYEADLQAKNQTLQDSSPVTTTNEIALQSDRGNFVTSTKDRAFVIAPPIHEQKPKQHTEKSHWLIKKNQVFVSNWFIVLLLVFIIMLGLLVFFGLFTRQPFLFNNIATATIMTPPITTQQKPIASLTPSLKITSSQAVITEVIITPTPTYSMTETPVEMPQAALQKSKLLQFDNKLARFPYQPFSIIILPPAPNNSTPFPSQSNVGFFYDYGSEYWRVITYEPSLVDKFPELNPLDINLGSLFAEKRLINTKALSLISDMVYLSYKDGGAGLYYIDAKNRYDFIVRKTNDNYFLEITKNKNIISNIPIPDINSNTKYWFYLQIVDRELQFFFFAGNSTIVNKLALEKLPFIYSVVTSDEISEIGIVGYNSIEMWINQLILYGD